MYTWYEGMKMTLYLSDLLPPNPQPSLNCEKNIRFQERKILHNTNQYPQNRQGHEKQGKVEKLSRPRGAYEGMTTICNVALGWDPATEKGQ